MARKKQTYEEWLAAKCEIHFSPFQKQVAKAMYYILNSEHVGIKNVICSDALAVKITEMLHLHEITTKTVNGAHIKEIARLFRARGKFIGFQSCPKGYYVDNSHQAMLNTLRFVFRKSMQVEITANHIVSIIKNKYGPDAVPNDLKSWVDQLDFEDWCNDVGFEPSENWCMEHGYDPISD